MRKLTKDEKRSRKSGTRNFYYLDTYDVEGNLIRKSQSFCLPDEEYKRARLSFKLEEIIENGKNK